MSAPVLYLASGSPRRSEILTQFGVPFRVIPNRLETERLRRDISLPAAVRGLALQKALASTPSEPGYVLGVDTIVVLDDEVLGKPADRDAAIVMLSRLAGRVHRVITGIGIVDTHNGSRFSRSDTAWVRMKAWDNYQIQDYIDGHYVLDKAGAYGIQHENGPVESIQGSRYTVMGLPIHRLLPIIKRCGILAPHL